jgi:hypothetical protein
MRVQYNKRAARKSPIMKVVTPSLRRAEDDKHLADAMTDDVGGFLGGARQVGLVQHTSRDITALNCVCHILVYATQIS